jgi:hypothetical protein
MPEQLHAPYATTCPENGHRMVDCFVFYCPHTQSYHLWVTQGTCEAPDDITDVPFGPFDDAYDVHAALLIFMSEAALLSLKRQ